MITTTQNKQIKQIIKLKKSARERRKQIIKTTKIITAMQIRRIKIQKLPVSWNLQIGEEKHSTKNAPVKFKPSKTSHGEKNSTEMLTKP